MATSFFNDMMRVLTDRGRSLLGRARDGTPESLIELSEHLLSGRGEASGVALAQAVLDSYAVAPLAARLAFLTSLADRFGADPTRVDTAIEAYRASPGPTTLQALHAAAEAKRQELLRRLNLAPGGTTALVRMREELLGHLPARPDLKAVDKDFTQLFSSWFNRGFLVLKPINWTTPANILEKIIRYEAVHQIRDWDDLRNRLEPPDRRCYGFFHPQLVDEPLIFVEVALTSEIPDAIAPLLDIGRTALPAQAATTAVFYSISNTQKGLAGVSFGNFLIKQVVEDLKRELPNLRTFVTLSPVPGFAGWLAKERRDGKLLDPQTRDALQVLEHPSWLDDPLATERAREALMAAAATYFLRAKGAGGRPVDPVARFHLGNGARLERMNFLGDTSEKGLTQSLGLMVNYLYALDEIERNHEAFAEKGEVVASPAVRKLLRPVHAPRDLTPAQ